MTGPQGVAMSAEPNPLLLDFPDAIETERLLIRAPRPGDGAALNAATIASLDHLRPWPLSGPPIHPAPRP